MSSAGNPNWVFDYSLIEDLPTLEPPGFAWPSHSFTTPTDLSVDFDDSFANDDGLKETGSRKRFLELGSILDPGRPPKMDKGVILGEAVRMAEKNELRDEKQRLKAEKDILDKQVKAMTSQPSFMHPPAMPSPFASPGQVVGGKLVPFVGYPGLSMWQFMPPAAVDTSQDHVLRPPVA
ncbi:hypothetical protein G4B88_019731 [Cannabis sativa]|uniref:Uncharacterized protein n=1 Tax=Cannabis sativa TaxID=3483 RepID=A0A7J6HUF7_CANSA|nr:hypothetical protein G4B88_019731 [Cannabis sativa]